MVVLRTPKDWTGPHTVDGEPVEDTWRSHQVPLTQVRTNEDHLRQLESRLRSYRPEELFDDTGRPVRRLAELVPKRELRMGTSRHANGGNNRDLELPPVAEYAVPVKAPGAEDGEPTKAVGEFLREVLAGLDGEACRLAYGVYVHRLVGELARMAAALGGVDAIAFTGGVGRTPPRSAPRSAAASAGWASYWMPRATNGQRR